MKIQKLGAGTFTIEGFLSQKECRSCIQDSENRGYEIATINAISGPEVNKEIRHNDRVIFDDPKLANILYQRAKNSLPQSIQGWCLTGFNERFRFYRYSGEHYFKWHQDGTYIRSKIEESMLTFMIYLNDNFELGNTEFLWEKIRPESGMALVFPHRINHRAIKAVNGIKYVLRTDVMFKEKT